MCSSLFHIFWHCAVKSLSPLSYQEYKYVWKCHLYIIHYNRSAGQMCFLYPCYKETALNILNGKHLILLIHKYGFGAGCVKACWRCIPSILPSLETRDPTFLLLLGNVILHNPSFFTWPLHLSCPHAKHCVQHHLRERNLTTHSQGVGEHKPAGITPLLLVI